MELFKPFTRTNGNLPVHALTAIYKHGIEYCIIYTRQKQCIILANIIGYQNHLAQNLNNFKLTEIR